MLLFILEEPQVTNDLLTHNKSITRFFTPLRMTMLKTDYSQKINFRGPLKPLSR
jgi:hypothetical protein